jgi:hypothetical protein
MYLLFLFKYCITTVKTRYKNTLGTEVYILMTGYSYVEDI